MLASNFADAPRITVVTPSYNQGDYIARTIDSVLSQGYPNLEYIIIDGGSTDQSVEVIRKYEKHLTYWVSEKDRGQSHAINKGMARATGGILTWLNSDDWYAPDALLHFASLFEMNPGAGVVVGRGVIVDLGANVVYDKSPQPTIDLQSMFGWLEGGNFMQPSSAFSRAAWEACGPLAEDIHIAMDVDIWLRFAKAGFRFVSTPELLSTALSHPKAKTTAFVGDMRLDCARVIAAHGSVQGYEEAIRAASRDNDSARRRVRFLEFKLRWYEKNYAVVQSHPLLRLLQPVVKRLSREGRYWQKDVPPWPDTGS